MYDSTSSADIPAGVDMVAGYTDGLYAWSAADWVRHRASKTVRICAVTIDMTAQVADIENGALTAAQGAEFLVQKKARGQIGALYFSRSRYGEVAAAAAARGLSSSDWTVWAAEWNGIPHIVPGTYATQYADPAYGSGGHYDVSLVADNWPGIDSPPAPAPAPYVPEPGLASWPDPTHLQFWTRKGSGWDPKFPPLTPPGWAQVSASSVQPVGAEGAKFVWTGNGYLAKIDNPPVGWLFAPLSPAPAPAPVPAPVQVPVPVPAAGPPVDQTRSAWAQLAAFFTQTLPGAVSELLRLLGLTKSV